MLTRLKVSGFKNLLDTEIHFGPFTCIAGANGVGKSNLFDAIYFLSRLADLPFVEAARATRGGGNLEHLFTVGGDGRMAFECDMIIPDKGLDQFQQAAIASQTYLRYELVLRLGKDEDGLPRVFLESETLGYLNRSKASKRLGFKHTRTWLDSVVKTSNRRAAFIEMEEKGDAAVVRVSSDRMRDTGQSRRGGGRPSRFLAQTLPRTALSAAQNADEARTAVLARAEMRSWRILQLEPAALREPDDLDAPKHLGVDGQHLPATLHRLTLHRDPARVYATVSNRLSELVPDVRTVEVDRDDVRRVLSLVMTDRRGLRLPASSLSDGTLRFIALSVMAEDPQAKGLLCLEEPENGIHPERIPAMVRLLRDMAVDAQEVSDESNPLRQVIVSTHSPVIAAHVSADELVFADHRDVPATEGGARPSLLFRPMAYTWRGGRGVALGEVVRYLGAVRSDPDDGDAPATLFATVSEQLSLFGRGK